MSTDDTVKLPNDGDELSPAQLTRLVRLIYSELQSLNQKVDARLHDTRPMWEVVIARLEGLSEEVGNVNRKLDVMNDDVLQVRADYKRLDRRLHALEKEPA
jgi:hypothetical protein